MRNGADTLAHSRVVVHTSEPAGGMAWYVSELVAALARSGIAVLLFCPANYEYEAEVRDAGAEVAHAPFRKTSHAGVAGRILRTLKYAARAMLAQFRLLRRGELVHFASTLYPPLGLAFFLPVILRRCTVVVTVHDPLPHRWLLPRGLRWLERRILQLPYRLGDGLIVHNETGKDVLVRHVRPDADRIFVIPHGPYPNATEGRLAFPTFDCLRLLAFGRIREDKGFHLAIRAVQMWPDDSRVPVRLTIAGEIHNRSEEKYWEACKQLIAAKPDCIEVIERRIRDEEIGPLLARHHAVLLPYTEFFSESGVANLALSHQRPILASASGGLGELIERGECGVPIAQPTVEAVSEAIAVAMGLGPERLHAMGIAGSQFVRKTRSWDSVARQTTAVYQKLAGSIAGTQESHAELAVKGRPARHSDA